MQKYSDVVTKANARKKPYLLPLRTHELLCTRNLSRKFNSFEFHFVLVEHTVANIYEYRFCCFSLTSPFKRCMRSFKILYFEVSFAFPVFCFITPVMEIEVLFTGGNCGRVTRLERAIFVRILSTRVYCVGEKLTNEKQYASWLEQGK